MTNRESLVKELESIFIKTIADNDYEMYSVGRIADFILADRRRVVEQIIILRKEINDSKIDYLTKKYCLARIEESIKNAGVENE